MSFFNWELAKEPLNWLTVLIMGLFFVVLISLVSPEVRKDNA